jgi:DNA-binding NarL/FixJ family response regulator
MPRRENPIDPAGGLVAAFARELRAQRQAAGAPSYREMAQKANYAAPALSRAASGRTLPSWTGVCAYLKACDITDESCLAQWRRRWEQARAADRRARETGTGGAAASTEVAGSARESVEAATASAGVDSADLDPECRTVAHQIPVMIGMSSRLVRDALAQALAAQPDIAVVGQATDLPEATAKASALAPAVLVAEPNLPADLQHLDDFVEMYPGCALVAVTDPLLPAWLEARANLFADFVSRESHTADLVRSIRSAAVGRLRIGVELASRPADAERFATELSDAASAHYYWTSALRMTPENAPERTQVLEHAAESAHQRGEHRLALDRLEELAGRPDAPGVCELHLRRARYLAAAGRSMQAEIEYELALEAPDGTPDQQACAAAFLAELLLYQGRYAEANDRATAALAMAAENGSTSDVVRASATLGFSRAFREDPEAGLGVVRHAVEIAERSGQPHDLGVAYLHLAELLTGPLNNTEEGVLVARRGAERLAARGVGRAYQTRLLTVAANGLFRVGQWAEAAAVLEAAMRHRPSGTDAVEVLLTRCRIWIGTGDVHAAHRDLDAVTALTGGDGRHVVPLLTLRAGLAIWQGEHAVARAAMQRALAETRSEDLILLGVLAWHGLRVEADARAAGAPVDPSAVRRLTTVVDRIAHEAGNAVTPVRAVIDGYLHLCRAEISRVERRYDPEPWARAVAVWERRNQPYPAAYARLRQAEASLCRKRGRGAGAGILRAAYATASALGAGPLVNEIALAAGLFQVTLHDGVTETVPLQGFGRGDELGALTLREREVLAAVAEGLTNREIAERLFVSERTIGVHIGHIFDKLQVRTRVQASRVYLTAA